MIDHRKRTLRLAFTLLSFPLVDGGQVVQHGVGVGNLCFQMPQHTERPIPRHPKGGDMVHRGLFGQNLRSELLFQFLYDPRSHGVHTSSGERRVVACRRFSRLSSRREGISAPTTSWEPTTQLSGLFSVATFS